jgi:hypothetical protein
MTQLSRPFLIALGAAVVLALAWVTVLHHPASSSSSTASTPPARTTPSAVYHGSAPGVEGLTRDIQKAHGAVTTEAQSNGRLERKSAEASGEAPRATNSATPSSSSSSSKSGGASSSRTGTSATGHGGSAAANASQSSSPQAAAIESELAHGKIAVLLFWDPKASVDQRVRSELHAISRRSGQVAVHVALPLQVSSFGGLTRGVQVLQTPTLLIINPKREVTTITGLTDARSIQQEIGNAAHGAGRVQAPQFSAWLQGSARGHYIAKANQECSALKSPQIESGSLKSEIVSLRDAIDKVTIPELNRIASIPKPAQDSAALGRYFSELKAGAGKLASALTAVLAGRVLQARELLFEGEARVDESSEGLASYGLVVCIGSRGY